MFKIKNIVVLFTVLAALGLSGDVWGMNGKEIEEKVIVERTTGQATMLGFKGNAIYLLTKVTSEGIATLYDLPTISECNQLVKETNRKSVKLKNNLIYYLCQTELEEKVDNGYIEIGNNSFSWVKLGTFEKGKFSNIEPFYISLKDLFKPLKKILQTSAKLKKNFPESFFAEHTQVKQEEKSETTLVIETKYPTKTTYTLNFNGKPKKDPTTAIPHMLHWAIPTLCATILGGLQEYLAIKKYNPGISYGITAVPAIAQPLHSVKSAQRTGWKKWIPVFTSGAGYLVGKYATRYVNQMVTEKNSSN